MYDQKLTRSQLSPLHGIKQKINEKVSKKKPSEHKQYETKWVAKIAPWSHDSQLQCNSITVNHAS